MNRYSTRQVSRIVDIPAATVSRLISAGLISPLRDNRGAHSFSFRDLVVLRAAKSLMDAKLPARRVSRALQHLRAQLPEQLPLTGLRVAAVGNTVVVTEGEAQWRVDDGQYLLAFDIQKAKGTLAFIELETVAPSEDWFSHASELEASDVAAALSAYEKATQADSTRCEAYINWGRLLHELGRLTEAASVYQRASESCAAHALVFFNFAVLREDQGKSDEAVRLYKRALETDVSLSDAHYNLALLYEMLGNKRDALRHLSEYRKSSG